MALLMLWNAVCPIVERTQVAQPPPLFTRRPSLGFSFVEMKASRNERHAFSAFNLKPETWWRIGLYMIFILVASWKLLGWMEHAGCECLVSLGGSKMSSRSGYEQYVLFFTARNLSIANALCYSRLSPSLLRLSNLLDLDILSGGIVLLAKL